MDGYDVYDTTNHERALRALNPPEYNCMGTQCSTSNESWNNLWNNSTGDSGVQSQDTMCRSVSRNSPMYPVLETID